MANITVFYGSVRENRQGIKAARFIVKELEKRNHKVNFLDAAKYKLPLLNKMHKEYAKGEAPEPMEEMHKILEESDAFVIVTGEYNHSPPPGLTNMIDHFQSEYFQKPSAIVSYSAGSFAGVRAAIHLRAYVAELGMSSIPTMLPVPKVQDLFDEDGTPKDEAYYRRAERFIKEIEWYADALKQKKQNDGMPN